MMKTPKLRFRLKALAAMLAIAAAPLAANAWTNKPVKMIVPAPPAARWTSSRASWPSRSRPRSASR